MLRELLEEGSVLDIIATFIALALVVASILCLIFIIVGGITFILSAGNEEKIKKAVHTIRFAIIGLFVTFIAFFAVSKIARLLEIPFELSFSTVIELMRDIFAALSQ
jgi:uncharacterized membrane protein